MTAVPRRVDAGSARLDRTGGDGWLAIGDAAMSFDPISSHGLLTALSTGLAAGETSLAGDQEFTDTTWRAYVRTRHACYASEERRADAPFWRKRRTAASHANVSERLTPLIQKPERLPGDDISEKLMKAQDWRERDRRNDRRRRDDQCPTVRLLGCRTVMVAVAL
jgi:flavin-dependent dehydrogenase